MERYQIHIIIIIIIITVDILLVGTAEQAWLLVSKKMEDSTSAKYSDLHLSGTNNSN